ncbi:hypothetical protein LFL97_07895 [Burkholderia sp. JSH-S8]|nr:hypothetical protein LFL97_07895 [Burkholderia sp. JSH-S8]
MIHDDGLVLTAQSGCRCCVADMCRTAVIDRLAITTGESFRVTQRAPMRGQIATARNAAVDAMQVDAEERRIVVIDLTAGSCWIACVRELPDTVNFDGIELTRGIADQSGGVADGG